MALKKTRKIHRTEGRTSFTELRPRLNKMENWNKAEFTYEGEIVWLVWKDGDRKCQAISAPSREMLKSLPLKFAKTAYLPEHVISDLRRRLSENNSIEGPEICVVVPFVGTNKRVAEILRVASERTARTLFDFAVGLHNSKW